MRIAYGDAPEQHGDLHLPDGSGPHPLVALVHGGFWLARYDATLMSALAEDLVSRAFAVWNIEYRRVGNGGGWPTTLEDVAAGIDHITTLSDRHPVAADRLVAMGHSAGGHLAAWLAARPALPGDAPGADPRVAVRGVVSQAGILDLRSSAAERLGGRSTQRFLGGEPDEVPERYTLASPVERLPLGVPVVAVHGEADDLVPVSQAQRFVEGAVSAGDDARGVVVEGEGHFEHLSPGSASWATAVDQLSLLLDRL